MSLASLKFEEENFKLASEFISSLIPKLSKYNFPKKSILNINIPALEKEDISGIAITELGGRMFTDSYEKRVDPRGKIYYWMAGELISEPVDAKTDIAAVKNNKISITPVTYEMTNEKTISNLEKIICDENYCNWF